MEPLRISREVCIDYGRSSRLEWLETNGTGGFAMGTVSGANTRRYHGLLVASLRPPVERHVTLAKLEETALTATGEVPLSTNQYPGTLHPSGFLLLEEFRSEPCPTWIFRIGETRLEKRVFLLQGEQTVVVTYRSSQPLRLRIVPLLAFRDYHALVHRHPGMDSRVFQEEQAGGGIRVRIQPDPAQPALQLSYDGDRFLPDGGWNENVEYLEELDRGLDFREDLLRAGTLELEVGPGRLGWVVATLEADRAFDRYAVERLEVAMEKRRTLRGDPVQARLGAAADQFLVRRGDGTPTVIAGYPWFTDWGRDTMISLPGLLIARGRLDEARAVVEGFLDHLDGGLVPNRFPDQSGPAEYNTADATLWMFETVSSWERAGGAASWIQQRFYPLAKEILAAHARGTHHGIRVDPADGLLVAGDAGTQLTWMDARVDGRVVTPRHGKPVEVNALWFNALRLMQRWAGQAGDGTTAEACRLEADRVQRSFERSFWNPATGCLFDVIRPDGPDPAIRPNQLVAISVTHPLLNEFRALAVLRKVESELLTPVGLRSLAPSDPAYQPHYAGGPQSRDAAYHQGLVWPWLIGLFVDAYLRAHGNTPETRAYLRLRTATLERRIGEGCLGTLPECNEPEPPYRSVAAPAQAWSVAEALRVHLLLREPSGPVPPARAPFLGILALMRIGA